MADIKSTRLELMWYILAHKGEVVIAFSRSMSNLSMPPQVARDLAKMMIENAEVAEQQMDGEGSGGG